ncbi:MAG: transglycosylase SLT domain-containing protein [Oligoflexia bacterium]|nr:transglycosylase SLT domain-containing protein [Oligoflexia bacterium]
MILMAQSICFISQIFIQNFSRIFSRVFTSGRVFSSTPLPLLPSSSLNLLMSSVLMFTVFAGGCSTLRLADTKTAQLNTSAADTSGKLPQNSQISISPNISSKAITTTNSVSENGNKVASLLSSINENEKKEATEKWIQFYTKRDRARFAQHLKNGNKYRSLVESIFKKNDLPSDLYYLGIIESGYNLNIKSKAKAVGPWQFMRGTAIRYGLKVNQYFDERKNIFKSTQAAAMYLKDLFNIFNDWELALAAYNAGEYKILRAIQRGKSRTYDSLNDKRLLPKETRNYLPKLLAVKTVEQNLKIYGLEKTPGVSDDDNSKNNSSNNNNGNNSDNMFALDAVSTYTLNFPVAVNDLLESLAINEVLFRELNPDIKGPYVSATEKNPFDLYLPIKKVDALTFQVAQGQISKVEMQRIKSLAIYKKEEDRPRRKKHLAQNHRRERERDYDYKHESHRLLAKNKSHSSKKERTYVVRPGDSYFKIAMKLGVNVDELKVLNGNRKRLYPNERIGLPSSSI